MFRHYNGWRIIKEGGFCTMTRYSAAKSGQWHWAFLLRECKDFCDLRDGGKEIPKLYLESLYT